MIKDDMILAFDSFREARDYFGVRSSNFPDYCQKSGYYKGWRVLFGETPYHGMHKSSLYRSWNAMKTRCTNSNRAEWKNYGGRGIKLYHAWKEFIPFMEWAMANGYEDGLTIERIDVNGDYCPDNCCWIPHSEQAHNKTTSVFFEVDGVKKTITQWAREYNIPVQTVQHRLRFGWDIKDALTKKQTPFPEGRKISYNGKTQSARQWGKETGLNSGTIIGRLDHGWTVEDALTTPSNVSNRKQKTRIPWR